VREGTMGRICKREAIRDQPAGDEKIERHATWSATWWWIV